MRNHLPLALDLGILIFAWIVVISRFCLVRNRHARIVTVLILCFTAVDTLKAGPINDALTFYLDARTVRLAAHVLCVVAAAVAAWAAASAAKRLRPARLSSGVVAASAGLIALDGLAGQRDHVIEAVHPQGIAVAYFTIYAGSIVVFEAYAATVLAAAIRTDRPNRGLLAPSATVVALFLATGLNALTLLWFAIRAATGDIGPAEQFQRNSNGNLFAYFTLVVALVGATAVIRRTSGESAVNRSSVNVTELQVLWGDLTDAAPHVKLDMKDLDPDARTVRMITECIDTLYDLGLDPATVTIADLHSSPSAPNSTTLTDSRVTATDVIDLARRWDSQSLRD
ncbi:hypothetical protein OPAG_09262 [Rhodococcus opacus PD630]|uniref:hypothetical protein n=1 Tax=Rhodococcus opacus TaxID=37919 RepID=UPI00029CB960|nr:hypothetical protein [Rhodococcus opacus]EHI41276.1 hypothetical protein OPAG_09262 [Rhodococcus opacus PD630]UDH01608.1 hypothetical protein K2Z90_008177 [Rhodococcus opacus PD630]